MIGLEEKNIYLKMMGINESKIITEADSLYVIIKRVSNGKTEFAKVQVGSTGQTVSLVNTNIVSGDANADKIIATENAKLQPQQKAQPQVQSQTQVQNNNIQK